MEPVVVSVAEDIINAFIATSADAAAISRPLLVAIAGVPGSGKTTLARRVAQCIRDMNSDNLASSVERGKVVKEAPKYTEAELPEFTPAGGATAAAQLVVGDVFVMGMDGYHMYRSELDQLPNPKEAHRCRGAHWTFNPRAMAKDLIQLLETGRLDAPSFDHALKDPTPNAIHIDARTVTMAEANPADAVISRCIVIVEGLYLALREPADWAVINDLFDFVVFLSCDLSVSTERLVARHMAAWGCSREDAMERAMGSDRANAELVVTTAINAHVEVESVTDTSFDA